MGEIITETYATDGTLVQLKNTCEVRGWKLIGKLTKLKHSNLVTAETDRLANTGEYESKEWRSEIWKELFFVELKSGETEEAVRKEHEAMKQTFIFAEDVFVEKRIARVIGFGIPNSL